jgi:hypothetical protein
MTLPKIMEHIIFPRILSLFTDVTSKQVYDVNNFMLTFVKIKVYIYE